MMRAAPEDQGHCMAEAGQINKTQRNREYNCSKDEPYDDQRKLNAENIDRIKDNLVDSIADRRERRVYLLRKTCALCGGHEVILYRVVANPRLPRGRGRSAMQLSREHARTIALRVIQKGIA